MRQEYYQDMWVKGETVRNGERECSSRYPILNDFCQRFKTHFSVLDFGCNMGYFSFRLASDFDCEVVMIDYEPKLPKLAEANDMTNVSMVNKGMSVGETKSFLSGKHFDLILAMSVLHHSKEPERLANLFIEHSDNVIFEIEPENENKKIHDIVRKKNPILMNPSTPHCRPIYYVNENEVGFTGNPHAGCGDAGTITIPAYSSRLKKKIGVKFYNGTLNVRIDKPILIKDDIMVRRFNGSYNIIPLFINGYPVHNISKYKKKDTTVDLELISPVKLRDKFDIFDDNQVVTISIDRKYFE